MTQPLAQRSPMSDNRYRANLDTASPNRAESSPSSYLEVQAQALTQELLLLMLSGQRQSEAVLAYLAAAEWKEPRVALRDDIRISWLCVLHAAEGHSDPWRYAFWRYLGKTPEKLIPEFVARASRHATMEAGSGEGTIETPLPPKKPPIAEGVPRKKAA